MINIDKTTYWANENSHYKTKNPKTQIIIGTSLRKSNYHILRLQNKEYHKTKRWNTFTISREGNIYQHYDYKYHTDFLNKKEIDIKSVSIILENMGILKYSEDSDNYVNWINEVCDIDLVVEKSWLGNKFWETLNPKQIASCGKLCNQLCDELSIPKEMITFQYYNKNIEKFKGICFVSNHIEESFDINPFLFNSNISEYFS